MAVGEDEPFSDPDGQSSLADENHAAAWLAIAFRRLEELDSGLVKAIPGDEVFERVRRRLGR